MFLELIDLGFVQLPFNVYVNLLICTESEMYLISNNYYFHLFAAGTLFNWRVLFIMVIYHFLAALFFRQVLIVADF